MFYVQRIAAFVTAGLLIVGQTLAAPPRVVHEKYKLALVASEPDIATPIGMAFDCEGRLLVVESHTHQRPDGYDGPAGDRIRMFADSDGDGQLDRWTTFAEGFRHAMNIAVRPDGGAYLVARDRVLLLRDTNGDGASDEQKELVRLESDDDYPHNGLSGVALASDGSLLLGLGENHGISYRLVGSDGKVLEDGGGEDGIFRCTADGANIERIARGVWNPFAICALPDGRVFAVDNDPDSSPPCRLLHIVEGGDYGYLYQYGRAGTHPLQAWNGELPGTLPMVCGVGEAPTAIVAHAGSLWVTSWGDHRIERYRLVPRGASYGAEREVVVQGDADFRPTGMAVAPDGSLYFGDWVRRDYPVHGLGRIWRLVLPSDELGSEFPPLSEHEKNPPDYVEDALAASESADQFVLNEIVRQLSANNPGDPVIAITPRLRLLVLQSLRLRGGLADMEPALKGALLDASSDVRLFAVRWIADERIMSLRDDVARLLEGPQPNAKYYLAVLAAVDWLDHEPSMRGAQIADELLLRELRNKNRSPEAHALALRLLSPDSKFLTQKRLRKYLRSDHSPLRLEAVRSLAQQTNPQRFDLLAQVAADESQSQGVRAEAIVGLGADAPTHRDLLERIAAGDDGMLAEEAERVLRSAQLHAAPKEIKPPAEELPKWNTLLAETGDAEAGRRIFFSQLGPRCGVCHQHSGRGGRIGPDLTNLAAANSREAIIASIIQPSREIAPHYQTWLMTTGDGKIHAGLRLHKAGDDGTEAYVDSDGKTFTLASSQIENREAAEKSIMPDDLPALVTIEDLRDLVTFLCGE